MPAAAWPGTVQKNVYLPGLSVIVILDVPPWPTTLPFFVLMPLPLIATLCWKIADGFFIEIVIFPAFAFSFLTLNLSAVLLALILSVVLPARANEVAPSAHATTIATPTNHFFMRLLSLGLPPSR